MPLTADLVDQAEHDYRKQTDRFEKLARAVAGICEDMVSRLRVPATVLFRAKSPRSFREKLERYVRSNDQDKIVAIDSAEDAIDLVGDLAGVRVITYIDADRERVVARIASEFSGQKGRPTPTINVMDKPGGYRATHCQVSLPEAVIGANTALDNVRGVSAEIQVCSMLAHVWNEIEHDLRYKEVDEWGDDAPLRDSLLDSLRKAASEGDGLIVELLRLRSRRAALSLASEVADMLPPGSELGGHGVPSLAVAVRFGYQSAIEVQRLVARNRDAALALVTQFNNLAERDADLADLRFDDSFGDLLLAALVVEHGSAMAAVESDGQRDREAAVAYYALQVGLLTPTGSP